MNCMEISLFLGVTLIVERKGCVPSLYLKNWWNFIGNPLQCSCLENQPMDRGALDRRVQRAEGPAVRVGVKVLMRAAPWGRERRDLHLRRKGGA